MATPTASGQQVASGEHQNDPPNGENTMGDAAKPTYTYLVTGPSRYLIRLEYRSPEMYKGIPAVFFMEHEEEEMAKVCRMVVIGKFSHRKPLLDDIRRDFSARFPMRRPMKIGHYDVKHVFIDFTDEEDFKGYYFRDKATILGSPMRL
ncbi:hypothetical protein A4A49_11375 [Nicotiana attenuata]|uniref:DUF4283 domain-containing protein n=1 Tax=Nicotiana attenuata TaxID=49451 RepID=A0A314KNK6_NICAT|nr:hypothetical protein A4A49_11375 [Nicotiana attenuata]